MWLPLFSDENQNPGLNFQLHVFFTCWVIKKDAGLELSLSTWRSRFWKGSLSKVGKSSGWDLMQNPQPRGDNRDSPTALARCLEPKFAEWGNVEVSLLVKSTSSNLNHSLTYKSGNRMSLLSCWKPFVNIKNRTARWNGVRKLRRGELLSPTTPSKVQTQQEDPTGPDPARGTLPSQLEEEKACLIHPPLPQLSQ